MKRIVNSNIPLDEDFELPIFEKRTKMKKEISEDTQKIKPEKYSFKRFLADQINSVN